MRLRTTLDALAEVLAAGVCPEVVLATLVELDMDEDCPASDNLSNGQAPYAKREAHALGASTDERSGIQVGCGVGRYRSSDRSCISFLLRYRRSQDMELEAVCEGYLWMAKPGSFG